MSSWKLSYFSFNVNDYLAKLSKYKYCILKAFLNLFCTYVKTWYKEYLKNDYLKGLTFPLISNLTWPNSIPFL